MPMTGAAAGKPIGWDTGKRSPLPTLTIGSTSSLNSGDKSTYTPGSFPELPSNFLSLVTNCIMVFVHGQTPMVG